MFKIELTGAREKRPGASLISPLHRCYLCNAAIKFSECFKMNRLVTFFVVSDYALLQIQSKAAE